MALLFSQILKLTPKSVRQRAERVAVLLVSASVGDNSQGPYLEATYRCRTQGTPRLHKVVIRQYDKSHKALVDGGRLRGHRQSWVHCTCEFFMYVCEFALTRHKSSSIINTNGKPPYHTNPGMIPMCCKHITSVAAINPGLNLQHTDITVPSGSSPLVLKDISQLVDEKAKIMEAERDHAEQSEKLDRELNDLL